MVYIYTYCIRITNYVLRFRMGIPEFVFTLLHTHNTPTKQYTPIWHGKSLLYFGGSRVPASAH